MLARLTPDLGARIYALLAKGHELIFPACCVVCHKIEAPLCAACAQRAAPVGPILCAQCGRPQPAPAARCPGCRNQSDNQLDQVRSATLHTGIIRTAIHALKYSGRADLAPQLACYLVAGFGEPDWDGLRHIIDAVVPVPLHANREAERGFNQSALLASAFCRRTGLAFHPELLQRSRATSSQVGKNAVERRANVVDAFTAFHATGRHILLIDDVYTTGSTLQACAQALRTDGAATVAALTLAQPAHGQHDDLASGVDVPQ